MQERYWHIKILICLKAPQCEESGCFWRSASLSYVLRRLELAPLLSSEDPSYRLLQSSSSYVDNQTKYEETSKEFSTEASTSDDFAPERSSEEDGEFTL